jgi:hypothetical protein
LSRGVSYNRESKNSKTKFYKLEEIQIMKKSFQSAAKRILPAFFIGVVSFSLLAIFNCYSVNSEVSAQETLSGEWTAEISKKSPEKVQLNFSRRTAKGGNNMHGSSYTLDELQNLSREQITGNAPVRFQFAREAGTIDCEGSFSGGKGRGTWRFTPNQNFAQAMQSRGFTGFDSEKLFVATTLNLTVKYTDDLKAMGFANLSIDDVFKGRIFNITPEYAGEMKATGFPNLDLEDLVKARIFKVDAEFVRQVGAMGFEKLDMEQLTKLRIFNVTPEFLREVKTLGFQNLDIEDLVKFRIFKVSPEFINEVRAEGFSNASIEELVSLKIHNVDREFIRQAKSNNPNLKLSEIVNMRITGRTK